MLIFDGTAAEELVLIVKMDVVVGSADDVVGGKIGFEATAVTAKGFCGTGVADNTVVGTEATFGAAGAAELLLFLCPFNSF